MKDKIINWLLSLYLKSIIRKAGGVDDFTSKLKGLDNVLVDEKENKTTITHPGEKWTITIKTRMKKIHQGKPPRKL